MTEWVKGDNDEKERERRKRRAKRQGKRKEQKIRMSGREWRKEMIMSEKQKRVTERGNG